MNKIIIGVVLVLLLAGCSSKEQNSTTDSQRFQEEYEALNGKENGKGQTYRTLKLTESNPFVYKSAKEILEMIEKQETFVVYFGFASCPWCRSVVPPLIEVAADLEISKIYYVNIQEMRDILEIGEDGSITTSKEGEKDYYKLLEKLDGVLDEYTLEDEERNQVVTGEKRIYAPSIISIVDGVPIESTDGISTFQTDAYMDLTTEMQTESYDKIKCAIQCTADTKEVCSAKTKC